jgi:4-hydroxybenzoate polyprenyltransferase
MNTNALHYYIRLTRLDRPIGIYLLLWPTLSALWLAAEGFPGLPVVLIFTLGVVLMRSAGCVINDFADRKIDGRVKRTVARPLASGLVSSQAALWLFFGLLVLSFGLVLFTNARTPL